MKNPFEYGGVVSGNAFCDREKEVTDLLRAIENNEKLFVFSERRYGIGSTSNVQRAVDGLLERDIIDRDNGSFLITDRFFRLWIQAAQVI